MPLSKVVTLHEGSFAESVKECLRDHNVAKSGIIIWEVPTDKEGLAGELHFRWFGESCIEILGLLEYMKSRVLLHMEGED